MRLGAPERCHDDEGQTSEHESRHEHRGKRYCGHLTPRLRGSDYLVNRRRTYGEQASADELAMVTRFPCDRAWNVG
jgi:hypothetical protein